MPLMLLTHVFCDHRHVTWFMSFRSYKLTPPKLVMPPVISHHCHIFCHHVILRVTTDTSCLLLQPWPATNYLSSSPCQALCHLCVSSSVPWSVRGATRQRRLMMTMRQTVTHTWPRWNDHHSARIWDNSTSIPTMNDQTHPDSSETTSWSE